MSTARRGRRSSRAPTTRSTTTSWSRFERASGLPVLVNTSFNVHEEPIVNTPAECVKALTDGRVDFVVTDRGLYTRAFSGKVDTGFPKENATQHELPS